MNYRVHLSRDARSAIRECAHYIGVEQKSPENAERWLESVWDAIESLEIFPNGFPLAPENGSRSYEIRMRIIGKYILLYTVEQASKSVHIIGFRHSARLPRPEDLPDSIEDIE